MSVRVVARIRPLLKTEREIDTIVRAGSLSPTVKTTDDNSASKKQKSEAEKRGKDGCDRPNLVRIPNPKNEGEQYTFQFNAVYDDYVGQQEIFDAEGRFGLRYCGLTRVCRPKRPMG